jgi:hypothetical protein
MSSSWGGSTWLVEPFPSKGLYNMDETGVLLSVLSSLKVLTVC